MSKERRWLAAEIDRWIADGVITPGQGEQLRARYPVSADGLPWGIILFSAIGAVVTGLGVILLIAYNWDDIPKFGKLALILGTIALAHAAGVLLRRHDDWRSATGDAVHLFGSMLFGAGIWLVAQIYNIDEHYPNGFLIWGLGALAMAWALPSISQGMLAAITLMVWGAADAGEFSMPNEWATLLIACGVGPLVWRKRSAVLLAVVLAALYVSILFNAGERGDAYTVFVSAFAFSTLLVALARLGERIHLPVRAVQVAAFFGWTGGLICAGILSFRIAAREFVRDMSHAADLEPAALAYSWGLVILALAAWAWIAAECARRRSRPMHLEEWLLPAALLFAQSLVHSGRFVEPVLVTVVFNLVVLFTGALWTVRGCRELRLAPTVAGSLIIASLVFARYFDLFESLALRGATFVGLGAAMFAEAMYFRRARTSNTKEGQP
jgi:hypothetical protein